MPCRRVRRRGRRDAGGADFPPRGGPPGRRGRAARALRPAAAAFTALALAGAPLHAQVERPDSARPSPADTASPIRVEPLEVTVLRTPAAIDLVPYAVAALAGPGLRRARPGLGLDEALRAVPGVQVDNRFNYALGDRISIRGFGSRAQFGVRGVRVVLDGIPATLADGQTTLTHVDPRSLDRVEVLRGPASTLYGNAAGGVIRLRTVPPPAGTFRPSATLLAGEHGLRRLGADVGGRIGGTAYGLGITRFGYDGFREHGRADKLFAHARLDRELAGGELGLRAHLVDYDALNPGSLSSAQLAEDRTQAHGFNVAQRTGESARQGQLGVRWRRAIGGGEVDIAVYGLARTLENPIPPVIIDLSRRAAGLRAAYRGGGGRAGDARLGWTVGLDADLQRDERRNHVNEGGERGALALDQFERVRSAGAFAQLSVELEPGIAALAGVRYDAFRFAAEDRLVRAGDPDDSGSRRMDAFSPALGVRVTLDPAVNLYGNVATSFETPTTTELVNRPDGAGGFHPELEPQRTVSVEAGAKGRLGARFVYQAAAFRARTRDALIPFEVPSSPGRQYFRNVGSVVRRGVELGAAAELGGGLHARLAYTYLDARFESYETADGTFDGNRVPGAAPHRLEVATGLDSPAIGFLEIEARYVGRVPVDDANTAHSPAYVVTDLRAELRALSVAGVEARPFVGVTNLFDAEHNAAVVVNAFGDRYFEPGPGRAAYLGLTLAVGGS